MRLRFLQTLSVMTLSGLCMTTLGTLVSCESDDTGAENNYTITLDKDEERLAQAETFVVTPSFSDQKAANLKYGWLSMNLDVATVTKNSDGTATVTGVSAGTADIKIVSASNPKIYAICSVEVFERSIVLDKTDEAIRKGTTLVITPSFYGEGATGLSYTWTSSDDAVASVVKGANNVATVTGNTAGRATITITCNSNPKIVASCEVEVVKYTVTLNKTNETFEAKSTLVITPTFTPATGSSLTYKWTSSNTAVATVVRNANGTATVTGVAEGEATITVKADEDAEITASCKVTITPAPELPFAFDKVYIDGTAIGTKTEVAATLENANQFAWYGELTAGTLSIPALSGTDNYYVVPSDGTAAFATTTAGAVEAAKMSETAITWTIPAAGKYRIVINKTNKTMAVYSPAIDLKPKTVTWEATAGTAVIEVTDFYHIGDPWGWGYAAADKAGYVQSAADPQVLVWNKAGTVGKGSADWSNQRVKFVVWYDVTPTNYGNVYTITCPKGTDPVRQNVRMNLKDTKPLGEGYDADIRECWYNFDKAVFVNFFIIDLRNMTVYADFR